MRQADVRIVVASNAKLEKLVETRHFRHDLLYRLNVLGLLMPPLRERENDAVLLARMFLARFCSHYGFANITLHGDSEQFIIQYAWPGNVRELENVIHREVLMCEGNALRFGYAKASGSNGGMEIGFKTAKAKAVAEFERCYVSDLLERTEGNISRAARLAGQDRSAFGKLVRKHGLNRAPEAGCH
jgi:transcriptional regulator with GAF, ATPase, and Fis domain